MRLKNATIEHFVLKEKAQRKKILVFGAGVIAQTILGPMCEQNELVSLIECVVDNDVNKQNQTIVLGGKPQKIYSVEKLIEYKENNDYVIVITGSHYYEMVCQLEEMHLGNLECYIIPIMYTSHLYRGNKGVIKESEEVLIPKKIHYMWFGSKQLPNDLQRCVDSWKKYCPEYEIIRWDESNYDIKKHPYMQQAYERRQWGFIPDYARLDLLYEHGGIYLDTDVELIRSLDDLLFQSAFTSIEKWNVINIGGCTGAVAHHEAIGKILEERENVYFINENGCLNKMASGYYDTIPFIREGFQLDGKNQTISGMNIYGSEYFHPYDYMSGQLETTENTFSIHHFNGGWISRECKDERELMQSRYYEIIRKASN